MAANRKWWARAIRLVAFAGVISLSASAPPAQANWSDSLFNRLSDVLVKAGIDPDQIEMARFSIEYPTEAASVYEHASAQDYPFFGLAGAAKAARIGKPAIFTEKACNFPISMVDSVFAGASGQAAGAASVAGDFGRQYAQATSDQAKAQLNQQLMDAIPYYRDIPTICTFAFHTNFSSEAKLRDVANEKSQLIKGAYAAFKGGNVVLGFKDLAELGVGKKAGCMMIDGAVGDGFISRTPLLGSLAMDACSGITGVVFDAVTGLIKGGVGIAEAGISSVYNVGKSGVCAVLSFLGSGCSSAPPPPTAYSEATNWCIPFGGTKSILSKTNAPDDYLLTCNDGSLCTRKPGQPERCATGAEIAAHRAEKIALYGVEFDAKLPAWRTQFDKRWQSQCVGALCHIAITTLELGVTIEAKKAREANPQADFLFNTWSITSKAERDAALTVEEHRYRYLPGPWSIQFQARWADKCRTPTCRWGIEQLWHKTVKQVQAMGAAKPQPPYAKATPLYIAAEQEAGALVAVSIKDTQTTKTIGDVGTDPRAVRKQPDASGPLTPKYPQATTGGRPSSPIVRKGNIPSATTNVGKPNETTTVPGVAAPKTNTRLPAPAVAPTPAPRGTPRTFPKVTPTATPTPSVRGG